MSGGEIRRTTRRSPAAGISGRCSRSCQKSSPSAVSGRATPACRGGSGPELRLRAGQCPRSRARHRPGRSPSGHRSRPAITSPRATSSTDGPLRLTATRWPAAARSTATSWTCTSRARARRGRREHDQRVSAADRARPQRPGHDRAGAPDSEHAIDMQAGARPEGAARLGSASRRRARARRAARRGPPRCAPSTATTSAPGSSSAASSIASSGSARSLLVTATTPRVHVERAQDAGVLARLRHDAVVGRDRHQVQVDPGRAGDHRAHVALVPGDVDDRQPRAAGERHAARSRARSRSRARAPRAGGRCRRRSAPAISAVLPWSMWPAVPSVSGASLIAGAERAPAAASADRVDLVVGERARVEQHLAVVDPRDHGGLACAQPRRQRASGAIGASAAPTAGPSSSVSGSAPPPTRATARSRSAPAPIAVAEPARARRPATARSGRASPAPESRARAPRRVAIQRPASPRAPRATACRSAALGPADECARPRSRRGVPSSSPACGPPSSLSPEQQTSAAPAASDRARSGSSPSAPIGLVSASTPEPTSSITGDAELAQLLDRDLLDEPERPEVRLDARAGSPRPRARRDDSARS